MSFKLTPGRINGAPSGDADRQPLHVTLETILPFGKLKGFTVEEILEKMPSYLEWCLNEFIIEADDELEEEIRVAASEEDRSRNDEWLITEDFQAD